MTVFRNQALLRTNVIYLRSFSFLVSSADGSPYDYSVIRGPSCFLQIFNPINKFRLCVAVPPGQQNFISSFPSLLRATAFIFSRIKR